MVVPAVTTPASHHPASGQAAVIDNGGGAGSRDGATSADSDPLPLLDEDYTFDRNDPNFKHYSPATLRKIYRAFHTLPAGWMKNNAGSGQPPYRHLDGRTSWKNPGRDHIRKTLEEAEREHGEGTASQQSQQQSQGRLLKKYRRMIQNGVPIGAVVQTARREGVVDPALIEGKEDDEASDRAGLKSGSSHARQSQLKKYRRMVKNGVPLRAVEQTAIRDGVDPALITNDGGTSYLESREEDVAELELFRRRGNDQVEFIGDGALATLVRKLVQTVRKRRMGGSHRSLTVDSQDLYNALGAFRGVRHARDAYNTTRRGTLSESEARARQRPFLEHLQTLGIRPPQNGPADIEGLDGLVAYIENQYASTIQTIAENANVGMYDFDSLSELYQPGTHVVAKNAFTSGVHILCEVCWTRYEQGRTLFGTSRIFKVCFQFVVAVGGGQFTLCEFVETMESFDNRRNVRSLMFVPLEVYGADEVARMKEVFRRRGVMYNRCATGGANFLAYDEGSFYAKGGGQRGGGETAALRTAGRVMVDTQGAYDAGHSLSIGYDPMVTGIKYRYREYMLHMRALKQASGTAPTATTTAGDDGGIILFDAIPTDYLEMTWPAAVGFSFTSKTWGDVLIDGLSDVQFQESIFDNLVLPAARKRMVKALVRHSTDAFNDIVSGKGEGSVFLLYGPPGVGKTLTAEAISEMLHRPLYTVSLGQLGTTPAELETKLGEILDLCGRWDALILLDEADIFLEKRTSGGSLERNAMVSVMLRLVEYFKGVLFLTSNRVDSLDPAFKTRITLALRYDPLDAAARKQVWVNLLVASGLGDAVNDGLIDPAALAEHDLNGREIKNAIRLAMALAKEDGKEVSQDLVLETVGTLCDFNEKMNSADAY